jgi:glycosyltransferase involved in cell wall biosynthesis
VRVLHVIPSVSLRRGGPSHALYTMVRGLSGAGIDVHVATTDDDDRGTMHVPLGTPVLRSGGTFYFFPRQLRFYTPSWPLRRWVNEHVGQYDVVHTHAVFSFAGSVAAQAARRRRRPYIVRPLGTLAPYGLQQHRLLKRISLALVERPLLNGAARIHCTSRMEADEIRALGDWPIAVIPLGIDLARFPVERNRRWIDEHAPHLHGRRLLLFLSRLHEKKGVELLLDAFARVRQRDAACALIIAGSGRAEYAAALRKRAEALELGTAVYWTGHVEEEARAGLLAAADAFVLPSHAENFGIAVVEALSAGLPVVISDRVGVQQEVRAAGAGWIVPLEVEQWVEALLSILRDDDARLHMGEQARALARREFSADVMTRRLIDLYQSVQA